MASHDEKTAKLTKAFKEVDSDHSGYIDGVELEKVLTAYYKSCGMNPDPPKVKRECVSFMKDVDQNHDNKISQDEFVKYFMKLLQ